MLKAMRKHAKYFYVLFVIVIFAFIFWGVGDIDQSTGVPIATVGKEKISVEEYWREYDRAVNNLREIYKEKFDEEMEKKLKLKEMVLDSLIEDRLILSAAEAAGIKVIDKELEDSITNDPIFMRDGAFNRDVYLKTLELLRLTPQLYEYLKRRELTAIKMIRLIEDSIDISPSELKGLKADASLQAEVFSRLNAKRDIAFKSFVEGLKRQADIKINNNLIYQ